MVRAVPILVKHNVIQDGATASAKTSALDCGWFVSRDVLPEDPMFPIWTGWNALISESNTLAMIRNYSCSTVHGFVTLWTVIHQLHIRAKQLSQSHIVLTLDEFNNVVQRMGAIFKNVGYGKITTRHCAQPCPRDIVSCWFFLTRVQHSTRLTLKHC